MEDEMITVIRNITFPPAPRRGQGKWQRKLSELEIGDGFYVDITDKDLSRLRTIYQAAKSIGIRIESVRDHDKRIIKRVE